MDRINDDVCIIPDDIFDTYTKKRTEHDLLLWYLESGKVEQRRHFALMEEKMDELIRVIRDNTIYAEIGTKIDVLTESISTIRRYCTTIQILNIQTRFQC